MPFYQFDASAIVKRYVEEIGSDWVRAVADAAAGAEGLATENPNQHP